MYAKLIPFRKQPPQDVEVLYIMWHTGSDQMPAKHRYNCLGIKDVVWAWIPDRRMRRGFATKACQAAYRKWAGHYYRPPRNGDATPVRIFGGKKWKWYWLYKNAKQPTK